VNQSNYNPTLMVIGSCLTGGGSLISQSKASSSDNDNDIDLVKYDFYIF
jgi:hypothetical protein